MKAQSPLCHLTLSCFLLSACDATMQGQQQLPDAGPAPDVLGWLEQVDARADGPVEPCRGCKTDRRGMGGTPFDPANANGEFVSSDSQGALVVDRGSSHVNRFLWVADTALPGVVKIDMKSLTIVGRYRTGGLSPSRTTVNALGEAFIGSRGDKARLNAGVTKILPYGKNCPDRNKDGVVTSSTGPDDVLPWGHDECVAWHTVTAGDIRGLAAQDISGVSRKNTCDDFKDTKQFDPEQVVSEDEHYVWVGGTHGTIYKLDAPTGAVLLSITAPVPVYGAALAGDGKLWLGAGGRPTWGYLDTTLCTDEKTCNAAPVCAQTCTAQDCGATCDSAVKAKYTGSLAGYGITVDRQQRVWRSGWPTAGVFRYDPHAAPNKRYTENLTVPAAGGGIAADANGSVWAANHKHGLVRIDAETLQHVFLPAKTKGVAIATNGRVFGIDYAGTVHVVDPGTALNDNGLTLDAITLKGVAYAYSDMTGVQTRLASNAPGWYRTPFAPCDVDSETEWKFLEYDVDVPADAWAMFNVRVADTEEALADAPWSTVACISPPGGKASVPISTLKGKVVEVEVRLVAAGDLNNPATLQSTRIKSFGLLYFCHDTVG